VPLQGWSENQQHASVLSRASLQTIGITTRNWSITPKKYQRTGLHQSRGNSGYLLNGLWNEHEVIECNTEFRGTQ
jgi:hypothetical protein